MLKGKQLVTALFITGKSALIPDSRNTLAKKILKPAKDI